jgi:hypothetical protein
MSGMTFEAGNYKNITETGVVTAKSGVLLGFYVNSTSSGTIVFRDGGSSGTVMNGAITPAIGFHRFPAGFGVGGLHATIANTMNVTIFYSPS